MDTQSYLKLAPPVSLASLKVRIAQAPDGVLYAYVIVYEDAYETALGDGEFLYAEWAYLDQATAAKACEDFTEGCATYTIRRAELTYDGETETFSRVHDVGFWIRRYDAGSIVSFLTGEG